MGKKKARQRRGQSGDPRRRAAPSVSEGALFQVLRAAEGRVPLPVRAGTPGPVRAPQQLPVTEQSPPGSEPDPSALVQAPARATGMSMDEHMREVVAVAHWFEPPPEPAVQRVTLQLTGRRLDVQGPPAESDRFARDVVISDVLAGSGPVAVSTKVDGVGAGEWAVSARISPEGGRAPIPVHEAAWSWRRWRLTDAEPGPVRTRPAPLVRPPGLLPGSWLALVLLGAILALIVQSRLISGLGLRVNAPLAVSLLSILAGIAGAKGWYLVLRRKEGPRRGWIVQRIAEGWAVQGFVIGVVVTAPSLLALQGSDIGAFLDATAPALLLGMSIGRLGCFFTGCCAGRATRSRFGVWSSDRRLGMRRVPTQLIEAGLALLAALLVLWWLLSTGPMRGALFVAAIALYTLIRQLVLRFRAERRRSRAGSPLIALLSGLALVLDALYVAVR